MITWLLGGFLLGVIAASFLDDIMDWAKDVFNRLSSSVRKAWVYLRRVPGGIVKMIRYIQYGEVVSPPAIPVPVKWEEVEKMHNDGVIDDKTFEDLCRYRDTKIAELER